MKDSWALPRPAPAPPRVPALTSCPLIPTASNTHKAKLSACCRGLAPPLHQQSPQSSGAPPFWARPPSPPQAPAAPAASGLRSGWPVRLLPGPSVLSSALLQVLRRTRASEGVAARRGLCSHPHWVGSHEPKLSFHCNNALRGFGGLICYHVIPCLTLTSTPVSPISADDTAHSGQKPIMLFRLLHPDIRT